MYQATYNFSPEDIDLDDSYLTLEKGDIVEVAGVPPTVAKTWLEGYNRNRNQRGMFPSNYAKILAAEVKPKEEIGKLHATVTFTTCSGYLLLP